jgi:hypothetical protein
MSDTPKPKRHLSRSRRPPSTDSAPAAPLGRARDPRAGALPARIGTLEAELARLNEERGGDADELARMLVRIAEAERARTEAEESAEMAARRAGRAEQSAADGAEALERSTAERDADRARVTDLEATLARTRREHIDELAVQRATHAEADLRAVRALEEERSAAARARQQAAAAEVELAATRKTIARATELVEEMDRREEMTSALRARALDQARRILAGDAGQTAARSVASNPPKSPQAGSVRPRNQPLIQPTEESSLPQDMQSAPAGRGQDLEIMTLEEIEVDRAD